MFGNNGYKPGRQDEFDPRFAVLLGLFVMGCIFCGALFVYLTQP